jgi:histone deacetylase 11
MLSQEPAVVYTPDYDMHFMGLEKLHPFDSRKFSRAWNEVEAQLPEVLRRCTIAPDSPASVAELTRVHTSGYLRRLESSEYVLRALELPSLPLPPAVLDVVLRRRVLHPMALATRGTTVAAVEALRRGAAINLSGGYHHASRDRGEGFCIYNDVAVAVAALHGSGALRPTERVAIVDVDAHQGNGNERIFMDDPGVVIFDMFNADIWPHDSEAAKGIDVAVRLSSGTGDDEYLSRLNAALPAFLDERGPISLLFYNAGTDIFADDSLGRLSISADGVLERDRMVFNFVDTRSIPWVMVLSGGYSRESYRLIARSVEYVLWN